MERFARIILGYHGAKAGEAAAFARRLLLDEVGVEEWRPSSYPGQQGSLSSEIHPWINWVIRVVGHLIRLLVRLNYERLSYGKLTAPTA